MRPRPLKTSLALATLTLVLSLSSCTGSVEGAVESFLLIAYDNKVGLLDTSCLTNSVTTQQRKLFATVTLQDNSQALGYDVVSRRDSRSSFAILSRRLNEVSYLSLLKPTLQLPDDKNNQCLISYDGTLSLNKVISYRREATDSNTSDLSSPYACPSELQISRNGRYAVLLHDQSLCTDDNTLFDHIDIIDLQASPPAIVDDYQLSLNVGERSSLYLYQADRAIDEDVLYFVDNLTGLKLFKMPLNTLFKESSVLELPLSGTVLDLAAMNNRLIILYDSKLSIIDNFRDTPSLNDTSLELTQALSLIDNEFITTEDIYTLSQSAFSIFYELAQGSQDKRSISAVSGSLDSAAFLYLLGGSRISRFDIALYNQGSLELFGYDLLDSQGNTLTNSHFITWLTQTE